VPPTEASDATLPLPGICVTALRMRQRDQDVSRVAADRWPETGLVFTTLAGTAFEPRNFNRRFETRCARAGVPRLSVQRCCQAHIALAGCQRAWTLGWSRQAGMVAM